MKLVRLKQHIGSYVCDWGEICKQNVYAVGGDEQAKKVKRKRRRETKHSDVFIVNRHHARNLSKNQCHFHVA